jgi:hypothetical protein
MSYKDEDVQKFNDALRHELNQRAGSNDLAVILAFEAEGLTDVRPRENVFTFNAWKACGRSVLAGQKSVRDLFHLSQTQPDPNWDESWAIPEVWTVRRFWLT